MTPELVLNVVALLLMTNVAWSVHRLVKQLDAIAERLRLVEIDLAGLKARAYTSRRSDAPEFSEVRQ